MRARQMIHSVCTATPTVRIIRCATLTRMGISSARSSALLLVQSLPRTNALPDVEVTPSRGAVKNAAGGLADAGAGTGNVGRKTNTLTGNTNSKKGSPSLSKNQQKMQSQTVSNLCFTAKTQKNINGATFIIGNNTNKIKNIAKTDIINSIDGVTETSTQIADQIRKKKIGINILSDEWFEKYTGQPSSTTACHIEGQIYLRKTSPSILSDVVHEGTHALDFLNGVSEEIRGSWTGETKAYTEERLFQIAAGLPIEFETIDDMMVHIWMNYKR